MTKSKANQLASYFNNNPKAIIRKGAKKFKIVTTHTHNLLKTKTNIKYRQWKLLAKQSEQQIAVVLNEDACVKRFLTRILLGMKNLILICQTPQLLGMMVTTLVTPRMLLQTSSTTEKLNLKAKYWYSLQSAPQV